MSVLHLNFEYNLPKKEVYDWWTDLSGTGYVGRALKSIRPIGREGEKTLVETKWKIMGMTKRLVERLTLISEDHWIWQPTIFGIEITDEFRLSTRNETTVLTIESTSIPKGIKGQLANLMLGPMLDNMMVDEWKSASDILVRELTAPGRLHN